MAATIATVDESIATEPVFLVTRRELAVLAVTVAMVVGAVLLLIVTSGQVVGALAG